MPPLGTPTLPSTLVSPFPGTTVPLLPCGPGGLLTQMCQVRVSVTRSGMGLKSEPTPGNGQTLP